MGESKIADLVNPDEVKERERRSELWEKTMMELPYKVFDLEKNFDKYDANGLLFRRLEAVSEFGLIQLSSFIAAIREDSKSIDSSAFVIQSVHFFFLGTETENYTSQDTHAAIAIGRIRNLSALEQTVLLQQVNGTLAQMLLKKNV